MAIKECVVEKIHENCPECKRFIEARWLSAEEQEKLGFSNWTLVEYYFCACGWSAPCSFIKDELRDISSTEEKKYSKEKKLVKKISSSLLPRQDIKIRFVDNQQEVLEEYGYAIRGKDNRCVCLVIKQLVEKEKTDPGFFCEVIAHELAHASKEVFKNPQHNPYSEKFFVGVGHDKLWHDKYNEFRERIKNENLVAGSGYIATGKRDKWISNNKNDYVYVADEAEKKNLTTDLFKFFVVASIIFYCIFLLKKYKRRK